MNSSEQNEKQISVLIVEDEADLRFLYTKSLRRNGWEVWEAENGVQALAILEKQKPHVLLLDHRIPGMTGLDVFRAICSLNTKIPTIFVTAAHDICKEAMALGAYDCLTKPASSHRICEAIRTALGTPLT